MSLASEILGLPRGTDTLLRDLVHDHTGIYFDSGRADMLIDKLSTLVVKRGFNSFLDYYYFLKYDENAAAEWENVMNAISVGETYFWREIDQVKALSQAVLPLLVARKPAATIRIWSAACSTGEEPLTIAMALHEAGWFQRASIEIRASDASSAAIDRARKGVYRERSFRSLSSERRAEYFRPEGENTWRVRPDLQAHVRYSVANLMSPGDIADLAAADVIFCRNVFIYFSDAAIARTVGYFARYIQTPGYLFVGSAESLIRATSDFDLEDVDDAFVYVKEP